MKVKELFGVVKSSGEWEGVVCVELYKFIDKRKSFHTDCVEYVDDYSAKYADCIVVDYLVMDCEEMNQTLYANSCMSAEDIYGAEDKVLAVAIDGNY